MKELKELFELYSKSIVPERGQVYWDDIRGPFYLDNKLNISFGYGVAIPIKSEWEAFYAGYTAAQNKGKE